MDFHEEAFVLSARAHGDTGVVAELLTENHGLRRAFVPGGASRKLKPLLQAGARVMADYRARTSDQLGSVRLEAIGEGPSCLFDDPLALTGLTAASAVTRGALPEREPHSGAFRAFEALLGTLLLPDVWPAIFVRFEAGLLDNLGFGLDLSSCAVSGGVDDLVWVSPRTGRAVSRQAGAPYAEKLLVLPPFMLGSQTGVEQGDVGAGLQLTGHFLERFIFHPQNRPLPDARTWMVDRLRELGRL